MTAKEMFENQLFNMEETSSEIIYTNGDIKICFVKNAKRVVVKIPGLTRILNPYRIMELTNNEWSRCVKKQIEEFGWLTTKADCRNCEFCDISENKCLIHNHKCYDKTGCLHQQCKDYIGGTWGCNEC